MITSGNRRRSAGLSVSIGDATRLTGASRNTLMQQFRQLVEKGRLARHDLVHTALKVRRVRASGDPMTQ